MAASDPCCIWERHQSKMNFYRYFSFIKQETLTQVFFSVNFEKFFKNTFFKNTYGGCFSLLVVRLHLDLIEIENVLSNQNLVPEFIIQIIEVTVHF